MLTRVCLFLSLSIHLSVSLVLLVSALTPLSLSTYESDARCLCFLLSLCLLSLHSFRCSKGIVSLFVSLLNAYSLFLFVS